MKKSIFICAACLTMGSIYADAQTKEQQSSQFSQLAEPPAPPAPPPPAAPPTDGMLKEINALPPVPPVPAVPPAPPVAPELKRLSLHPVVINSIGYDVSIHSVKGQEIVVVKNNGIIKNIKMSTWLADRKYYEKKYGELPPASRYKKQIADI